MQHERIVSQVPFISPAAARTAPAAARTAPPTTPRVEPTSIPASTPRTIPTDIRHQFRQQDIERAHIAQRHHGPAGPRFDDEAFLVSEVEKWVHRCWTCTQRGYDDAHEMWRCGFTGAGGASREIQANKDWMKMVRGKVQYANYTAHFPCGMPQHICPLGDHHADHSEEVQERCRGYRTVLIPMVAMMGKGPQRDAEVTQRWYQRLASRGVVDPERNDEGLIQYFGQRAPGTAQKRSQLTEEFIWLRRAYDGRERCSD
ncbi:hypothetical protein N7532_002194 [Penicillium argentinense]|uniref:Uncharacterized protein n=1 Tax=Penicillium argentinense TaxID=1131581 RepID=A0A9W9FZZ9_9EURO|nr:uncharacterized protein N7532_002194 [Penicillium argentinense]KAJ5109549.1 hypothetical protein N7532_002194 [Penicillium argentinense]